MKITVLDLQSVVGSAHHFRQSLELCPNQGNVSFVAGDFLKPGLPKADMYAISRVLHDSPEKNINLLLSNVFKSLPSGEQKLHKCEKMDGRRFGRGPGMKLKTEATPVISNPGYLTSPVISN